MCLPRFHFLKVFNSINQFADLSNLLIPLFPDTRYCSFHVTLEVHFHIGTRKA